MTRACCRCVGTIAPHSVSGSLGRIVVTDHQSLSAAASILFTSSSLQLQPRSQAASRSASENPVGRGGGAWSPSPAASSAAAGTSSVTGGAGEGASNQQQQSNVTASSGGSGVANSNNPFLSDNCAGSSAGEGGAAASAGAGLPSNGHVDPTVLLLDQLEHQQGGRSRSYTVGGSVPVRPSATLKSGQSPGQGHPQVKPGHLPGIAQSLADFSAFDISGQTSAARYPWQRDIGVQCELLSDASSSSGSSGGSRSLGSGSGGELRSAGTQTSLSHFRDLPLGGVGGGAGAVGTEAAAPSSGSSLAAQLHSHFQQSHVWRSGVMRPLKDRSGAGQYTYRTASCLPHSFSMIHS